MNALCALIHLQYVVLPNNPMPVYSELDPSEFSETFSQKNANRIASLVYKDDIATRTVQLEVTLG